jgi:P27 family predicted phage terminase small subunit
MRGAKPSPDNLAMHPGADRIMSREEKVALIPDEIMKIAKRDLCAPEIRVWNRIAPELAAVGRVGPLYLDSIMEYCRVVVRLSEFRKILDDEEWTYEAETRNGHQIKSRPEVAQVNEFWRQWRSLVGELGLSPAAERGIVAKQLGLPFADDGWGDV